VGDRIHREQEDEDEPEEVGVAVGRRAGNPKRRRQSADDPSLLVKTQSNRPQRVNLQVYVDIIMVVRARRYGRIDRPRTTRPGGSDSRGRSRSSSCCGRPADITDLGGRYRRERRDPRLGREAHGRTAGYDHGVSSSRFLLCVDVALKCAPKVDVAMILRWVWGRPIFAYRQDRQASKLHFVYFRQVVMVKRLSSEKRPSRSMQERPCMSLSVLVEAVPSQSWVDRPARKRDAFSSLSS
jgi:hypothetical protein